MPKADKKDEPLNLAQAAWIHSKRGIGTVRSTHAELMRQIRQETGLNPVPLVRLSQVQPKRENRIALMLLRTSALEVSNRQVPVIPSEVPSIGLLHTPLTVEDSLLEQLTQESSTVDKAGLIQEVEHHLEQSEAPTLRAHYASILHQSGMFDRATHQAYRAVEEQPSAITLLAHGRSLSGLEPERALEVLQQALQLAETTQDAVQATCLQEIIATLMRLGRYRSACQWAKWALETQPETGATHSRLLEVWQVAATLSTWVRAGGQPRAHLF
jgi:tetratricopeptide (TPR) repeat protein